MRIIIERNTLIYGVLTVKSFSRVPKGDDNTFLSNLGVEMMDQNSFEKHVARIEGIEEEKSDKPVISFIYWNIK